MKKQVWEESTIDSDGFRNMQLHNSISQEELRRFVDLQLTYLDEKGLWIFGQGIPKTYIRVK